MLLDKATVRAEWRKAQQAITSWPSDAVCAQILKTELFWKAPRIGLFAAKKGEADLSALWRARPQACVYPKVLDERQLEFYQVASLSALRPGYASILEPSEGKRVEGWGPEDLVLVPGAAFDPQGGRVGSGAGFYDRFLVKIPATPWGVCWESQILSGKLAQETTDVRMRALCTESRVVWV